MFCPPTAQVGQTGRLSPSSSTSAKHLPAAGAVLDLDLLLVAHDGGVGHQVVLRHTGHVRNLHRQDLRAERLADVVVEAVEEERAPPSARGHGRIHRLEGAELSLLQILLTHHPVLGCPLCRRHEGIHRLQSARVTVGVHGECSAQRGSCCPAAVCTSLLADLAVQKARAEHLPQDEQWRGVHMGVRHGAHTTCHVVGLRGHREEGIVSRPTRLGSRGFGHRLGELAHVALVEGGGLGGQPRP
mmetsp:Transcript_40556/g.67949  ORF Transcript_40556/g.67949 Transcript_40556/m.67949 type:complete len:243 (+) Transcript_40556:538-1266(+)